MPRTHAELLLVVDPADLGRRIRTARIAAGLTHSQLLSDGLTEETLNTIEAGQRKPALRVLQSIAAELNISIDTLVRGLNDDEYSRIRADLDRGEFQLSSSDGHAAALDAADLALESLDGTTAPDLSRAAHQLRGKALEATGRLPEAVHEYAHVTAEPINDVAWVQDLTALSRCYRETGELHKAIAAGEDSRVTIEQFGLDSTTEALQLTTTTAAAYTLLGDFAHAMRTCKRAIADADRYNLPVGKASAMWNASIILQSKGEPLAALAMALDALEIFETSDDTRNVGRLRIHVANMQLALRPPEAAAALRLLEQARTELDWSTAGNIDASRHRLAIAYANESLGNHGDARDALIESIDLAPVDSQELRASQAVLQGRLAVAASAIEEARDHYQRAAGILSGMGADADVAQLWFELGEALDALGEPTLAGDAFKRASVSQGLHSA